MKLILLFSICLTIQFISFSQGLGTYQDFNIKVDNQVRTFKLYTPPGVATGQPTPLVLAFHGFGGSSSDMIQISEFYQAADTAGFFVVYPQGEITTDDILGLGTNYGWKVPYFTSSTFDDLGFVEKILDTLITDPNFFIDSNRIYSTGFSNGACFSFYLGCAMSNRFAAIAGVAGALPLKLMDMDCISSRRISSLQMFGTNDPFIPRLPPFFGGILTTSNFWAKQNDCALSVIQTQLPDKDPNDGASVNLLEFPNCSGDLEVFFYRINNGQHNWPGGLNAPNQVVTFDIDASDEIWKFFNRHTLDEKTTTVLEPERDSINVFPNPFYSHLSISLPSNLNKSILFEWYNSLGQLLEIDDIASNIALEKGQISFSQSYLPGIYYLKIKNGIEVLKTFRLIKVD